MQNLWLALIPLLGLVGASCAHGRGEAGESGRGHMQPYLVAMSVENLDSAYAWYRTRLGFQVQRAPYQPTQGIRIGFLVLNGFHLELIEAKGSQSRQSVLPDSSRDISLQGLMKLGFRVPDADALARALQQRGVALILPPTTDTVFHVRHFLVRDPDGNVLQFFQVLE